jgi:hypothetical protein
MKLLRAAGEPDATTAPQRLGLLQLNQAEQLSVETARGILRPWRGSHLDVVDTLDQGYLTWTPEIARLITRRWISEVPSKIV